MRETDLTDAVAAEICDSVRKGNTLKGAAAYAGFDESTLYKWLRRGRAGEQPFVQFVQALTRAREEAKLEALAVIRAAQTPGEFGVDDWRARAWFLERSFPEEFGKRLEIEVKSRVQSLLDDVEPLMSADAYAELVVAIARLEGLDPNEADDDEAEGTEAH